VAPPPRRPAPEPALLRAVDCTRDATRERLEVRNREHHAPVSTRHPSHLGDRLAGPVEVVERPLADHRVEARVAKRQRVGPAAHPARLRTAALTGLQSRQTRHPARRLGTDRPRSTLSQRVRVLTEAARDVQNPRAAPGSGEVQGAPGHPREEEITIARQSGRYDVAHVAVEIHHSHSDGF